MNGLGRVLPSVSASWRTTAAAAPRWLERIDVAPELQPLSVTGTPAGVLTAISVAGIALVMVLETSKPTLASLGSLLFIPVLASAWFLGSHQAIAVSALAIAARFVGYGTAGVELASAVAEVVTLVALGTVTRAAAVGLVEARARRVRAARERQALELLEQRERIAREVTDTAIRRLFAVTLQLEAASSQAVDSRVTPAVKAAIAELDSLTAELRTVVFRDPQR